MSIKRCRDATQRRIEQGLILLETSAGKNLLGQILRDPARRRGDGSFLAALTRYSGRSFSLGIFRARTGIAIIVIATAALMINGRGRKNQDADRDFTTWGVGAGVAAAFVVFFRPVPEPFAMGVRSV